MDTINQNNPPQTLPANFDFNQDSTSNTNQGNTTPPKTLPANFDFSQEQTPINKTSTGVGFFKDVGNFLFPIVGDVYNDVTGKSNKSVLQQVGDLGLSALPFIPGLGEVGEGARAVEGAGMLAKVAEALRTANPVVKGALTGYGAGVASNLSQGKDIMGSFAPNVTNVLSTVLGAGAPYAMGKFSDVIKGMAGLTPDIENELIKNVTPEEAKSYLNAVKERGVNLRAPTAVDVATNQFDTAAEQITKARQAAGKAVGDAKLAVGQQPVDMTQLKTVVDDFHNEVQDRYGISLAQDKKGNIIAIKDPISVRVVPSSVQDRIITVAKQLNSLQDGTLANASDVAANISDLVDYSGKELYGSHNDPLEGLIKKVDGALRSTINKTSPQMAEANAKFIELSKLENDIKDAAGNKLQRGNLLIRRATAGNSADAQELFNRIKGQTGIDLTKHSVLAKWATDVAGNPSEQSLFTQAIKEGAGQKGTTAIDIAKMLTKYGLNKVSSPESIGMRAVTGGNRFLNALGGPTSLITKGAIETDRTFTDLLKK